MWRAVWQWPDPYLTRDCGSDVSGRGILTMTPTKKRHVPGLDVMPSLAAEEESHDVNPQ